jgi:hypothetical protein
MLAGRRRSSRTASRCRASSRRRADGDLTQLSAAELAAALAAGEVSAREVVDAHLDRIAAVDGVVADGDVWAAKPTGRARRRRRPRLPRRHRRPPPAPTPTTSTPRAAGEELGPLAGVPLALKDVLTMRGAPTTCGSRMLEGWVPPYDATVTERLRAADVVVLGKTNMDEFAMGSSTENSAYGPPATPGTSTGSRRLVGRVGRRGRRAARAAVDRHRHRRVDPPAGGAHRARRRQADLRHGVALRAGRLRLVARPGRAVRPHRRGRRALQALIQGHDPRDSTSVPTRCPTCSRACATASRACGSASSPSCRARATSPASPRSSRGARAARAARRGDRRGVAAARRLRAAGLLPHRPVGGVVEPRPLRRGALRPAGRRADRRGDERRHPRRRVRSRGQAPHHDRHPRAVVAATTTPTTCRPARSAR